jgi:hypothetical protein
MWAISGNDGAKSEQYPSYNESYYAHARVHPSPGRQQPAGGNRAGVGSFLSVGCMRSIFGMLD